MAAFDGSSSSSQAEKSKNALKAYVKQALTTNNTQQDYYPRLLQTVQSLKSSNDPISQQQLVNLLHAISSNVSLLHHQRHKSLLVELLEHRLWYYTQEHRNATLDLICHLAVAQGAITHGVLELLCASIVPPPSPPTPEQLAAVGQPWAMAPEIAHVQDAIVTSLTKVLQLVPTAASRVATTLAHSFPHKLRDRDAQCAYLRGILSLAEGPSGGGLRDTMLAAIIDHVLTIDVEIKWEDIVDPAADVAAEEGHSSDDEVFELEEDMTTTLHLDDDTSQRPAHREGWEGGGALAAHVAPPASTPGGEAPAPTVDVTADKLDCMMDLVFAHVGRRYEAGQGGQVWSTLMDAFERSILQVHRSKFTQFVVFHAASLDPQRCAPSLLHVLVQRLTDARQPTITRSACAAYTASFLARAAYTPASTQLDALERLLSWTTRYAASASGSGGGGGLTSTPSFTAPSTTRSMSDIQHAMQLSRARSTGQMVGDAGAMAARHQVFYAAVQAVMYTMCYHMRVLLGGEERGRVMAVVQQLKEVLQSPLAPLHFCADSVMTEYMHQCRVLHLPLPPDTTQNTPLARERRPLEMFFPFDPYLLRRSAQHLRLRETYVRWTRGHSTAGRGVDGLGVHGDGGRNGEGAVVMDSEEEDDDEEEELLKSSSDDDEEDVDDDDEDGDDDDDNVAGSSLDMATSPPVALNQHLGALGVRTLSSHPSFALSGGLMGVHAANTTTMAQPIPMAGHGGALQGGHRQEQDSVDGTPGDLEGMSASPYGKSIPMLSCSMINGRSPMTTMHTS